MTTVHTLDQLDEFLLVTENLPTEDARRSAWDSLKVDRAMFGDFPAQLAMLDPYGPAYSAKVVDFMRFLHEGDYRLADEGFDHDLHSMLTIGFPHTSRSPFTVGSYLISYGFVIKTMNLPVPSKILEIGCGTGALSVHLARMGYELTAVDINHNFVNLVAGVCEGSPSKVTTIASDMNELDLPPEFDAVLFYESFHHSYDHPATIEKAIQFLKPGGMLVLAAEPVIHAQCDILPYPWGPRLDGETLRAIRRFGWMELGFTESYLFELFLRKGLSFTRISSKETHWADLIICRRIPKISAGEIYSCTVGGEGVSMLATGWSNSEEWGTWSDGSIARVVLDLSDGAFAGGASIHFKVIPFLPLGSTQHVRVNFNGCTIGEWQFFHRGMKPEQPLEMMQSIRLEAEDYWPDGIVSLEFVTERPMSPHEVGLSEDKRKLGFAVTSLMAYPHT